MNTKTIEKLCDLAEGPPINAYGDDNRKADFHFYAKRLAREIAADLGLVKGTYDVRTNLGGIAVCGETTLHADRLYVQVSQGVSRGAFMYRSCSSRKDYTGGFYRWMRWADLRDDPAAAVEAFRAAMSDQPRSTATAVHQRAYVHVHDH